MIRPLPRRILASAVLSVASATCLLGLGVLLARPAMRDAMVKTVTSTTDLSACQADPAAWGSSWGAFSLFAYDATGRSANPAAPALEPALLEQVLRTGRSARDTSAATHSIAVVPTSKEGSCAVVRMSTAPPTPLAMQRFVGVLLLTTLAGMVLAGSSTWWFVVRPLVRRVEALSEAAGGVGRDGFSPPEHGADALGHIGAVLARSHGRIVDTRQALEQRNRALEDHLAGIAHDLRTPLAGMQLSLESLAAEAQGPLQQESRRALADVVYLSALVDNLHQGTRLRHAVAVSAGRVDLVEVVQRLAQRFAIVGRHTGVEVAANTPDAPVWATCTPALAERAIANLVQNAVEHNPGPGHVAVLLSQSRDGTRFEIEVADDGPGLPQAVLASLEAESFLLDAARQRGPGLGMMITAEVARRAGWELSYEVLEPQGLRVRLVGAAVVEPS